MKRVGRIIGIMGALGCILGSLPLVARAHHGVAVVSIAGPEGPGAALETTSALSLPAGTLFGLAKTEYMPFRRRGFAEPENKRYSSFNTVAIGYGLTPWLSAYVFQPFSMKAQDSIGRNAGLGDTSLMLTASFKYDGGLRLIPEKESLDDLEDWHFAIWVASSLPVGRIDRRDDQGEYFAPDMQSGFGGPSPTLGVAALKQLSPALTWLADASYQHFFPHEYAFTRYRFGGETRLNTAVVYRAFAGNRLRADLSVELNGLHLQRDRERDQTSNTMTPLTASGGAILYAAGGIRLAYGPLSLAIGAKRAVLTALNEGGEQQGSEGLERVRAMATLGFATGI